MKFIFSKIFLPGLFGLGGGLFLLTSCRTGERFNGWYLPWLAVAFSLFSRGAWLYSRCFRERIALRAERKRLVGLLAEQEKRWLRTAIRPTGCTGRPSWLFRGGVGRTSSVDRSDLRRFGGKLPGRTFLFPQAYSYLITLTGQLSAASVMPAS